MAPKYPHAWPKGCTTTMTAHEFLLGASGKVEEVWTLRPACAEIDKAAVEAIKKWEYEPVIVEGKAIPVCATVTINVHLR